MAARVAEGKTKLSLHGMLTRFPPSIREQYRAGLIEVPSKISLLQEEFGRVRQAWKSVANADRTTALDDDVRPFDTLDAEAQVRILDRARLDPPYGQLPVSLRWFRIDRLVTAQLALDIGRGRGLLPDDAPVDDAALAKICLDPERLAPAIRVRSSRNTLYEGMVELESDDEDVRIYVPPVIRPLKVHDTDASAEAGTAIAFIAAKGAPFVSVAVVPIGGSKARFIVYNGTHRLYRIRARGKEWAPALMVQFPPGGFPTSHGDLSGMELMDSNSTLPLFGDFFNPALTVTLQYRPISRRLRLRWDYEVENSPAQALSNSGGP
jgi:hypothetical protein